MKFSVDKCFDCGIDLTTAEPAEVTYPGNDMVLGSCPGCGKPYFMAEVTPPLSPEVEPEPEVPETSEAEPTPEPEPSPEPAPEPEPEAASAEPEPEPAPEPAPEPEPET